MAGIPINVDEIFFPGGYYVMENPVRQHEQEATAKAEALLLANTGHPERFGHDCNTVLVLGGESGMPYRFYKHSRDTGPVAVELLNAAGLCVCQFCVYTEGTTNRPAADELVAMAFYIKHAERLFLETAVPHVNPHSPQFRDYLETCAKAGARNDWVRAMGYGRYYAPDQVPMAPRYWYDEFGRLRR